MQSRLEAQISWEPDRTRTSIKRTEKKIRSEKRSRILLTLLPSSTRHEQIQSRSFISFPSVPRSQCQQPASKSPLITLIFHTSLSHSVRSTTHLVSIMIVLECTSETQRHTSPKQIAAQTQQEAQLLAIIMIFNSTGGLLRPISTYSMYSIFCSKGAKKQRACSTSSSSSTAEQDATPTPNVQHAQKEFL